MTLHITKTKAEQQLLQQFEAVADQLPGGGWVPAARKAAIGEVATLGLPHRRIEAWKYTDLRVGVKEAFPPALPAPVVATSVGAVDLAPLLGAALDALDSIQLVFVNGTFQRAEMLPAHAPGKTWHFGPLAKALGDPEYDWLRTLFAARDPKAAPDPIAALNAAFMTDGALLRILPGAEIAVPIHIVLVSDSAGPSRVTTRHAIEVGAGAKVTLIESHVGRGDAPRQTSSQTHLGVKAGAHVSHIKLLAEGSQGLHLGTWDVEIGEKSTYRAFQMTAGAGIARSQLFVRFAGEGATADLSGVMLARGTGHIDTTLLADHAVPGCTSRELFKSVLRDRGRAVFQGKLLVRPDAQKTDAKQMAQGLLLSEDAEFISKPELEIYADDVACGHGSTSGQIDDDLLFYLRARGIAEADARAMLVTAFIGEALETIRHEGTRDALAAVAERWLRQATAI